MCAKLSDADVAAVRDTIEAALGFIESGDVEQWLQCWTEGGVSMPPGTPAIRGRAQLETFIREWLNQRIVMSDIQIDGRGDLAVQTAHLTFPGAGPNGTSLEGKHMHKLIKQPDGRWLMAVAIFNLDVPIAP